MVKYRTSAERGLEAYLVALRDIPVGEELVQSYIDYNLGKYYLTRYLLDWVSIILVFREKLLCKLCYITFTDFKKRQQALLDYGFQCSCSKCFQQSER